MPRIEVVDVSGGKVKMVRLFFRGNTKSRQTGIELLFSFPGAWLVDWAGFVMMGTTVNRW